MQKYFVQSSKHLNIMQTLEQVQQHIWQQLTDAQKNKQHPFRLGAFATVGQNGTSLRTVVVRKVIPEETVLWLYTDFRSPKVQEIQNNPNISWLFYDSTKQIQIRLHGNAEILRSTMTNHYIWNNLPEYSKSDYLTQQAPGSTMTDNPKVEIKDTDDSKNFCIIKTKIETMDWLQLNRSKHSRAKFELENGAWQGEWLVP
jgi:pyridoxine/pyridoxamine 5'-phosphate oxidase